MRALYEIMLCTKKYDMQIRREKQIYFEESNI